MAVGGYGRGVYPPKGAACTSTHTIGDHVIHCSQNQLTHKANTHTGRYQGMLVWWSSKTADKRELVAA